MIQSDLNLQYSFENKFWTEHEDYTGSHATGKMETI